MMNAVLIFHVAAPIYLKKMKAHVGIIIDDITALIKMITPEQMAKSGSEDGEQLALMQWCVLNLKTYPELKWLHHSPNGGSRNKREGAKFKAMGVRRGYPDLSLLLPCRQYHGLLIELKKISGGVTSNEQQDWLDHLNGLGYYAAVCKGWIEAISCLQWYLKLER